MLLVIGPRGGLALVDAFELRLIGITSSSGETLQVSSKRLLLA